MLYNIVDNSTYIQTDNISKMVRGTLVVTMNDGSTYTVSAAQFNDIIAIVNAEANH
jgi:hypothetical protein